MNPSNEERELEEYRRVSAAEAGRPGAATRSAILAEAAAAARQRTPAANDSRYLWRGVAGVAVLGFAILLWRQVDHRMPGDTPVVAAAPSIEMAETKAQTVQDAVIPQSPAPAAAPPAIPPLVAAAADVAGPVAQRAAEMETSAKAEASGAAANALQAAPAPALGKMSAAQDAAASVDVDALLRRHFPDQYQSDRPHSLWLIQNPAGTVLRSGELAPGQTFAELRSVIERDLGGTLLRPWRIRTVPNARGQLLELATAQTP